MAPNNAKVNQLFGVTHGLAMGVLTFDWGQITYNGSPLPVPWWAAANIGLTVVFFYWFLTPILYVSRPCFPPVFAFSPSPRSTQTSGTAPTFLWCLRIPSIILGRYITSPRSSTQILPSTSTLTKLIALYSSPPPSPSHTDSRLHRSLPPSHTHFSTTASRYISKLVARSPNNLIFTLASCPCTRRFPIGGIW